MKKTTKIFSLILAAIMLSSVMTACNPGVHPAVPNDDAASSEPFTPHRFGIDDARIGEVRIGMTPDHVKKILGDPESEELMTQDNNIYGAYIKMEYDGINLTFYDVNGGEDYTLGTISSDSETVKFVGGLHVGSTKDEVLNAFTHEEDPQPLYFDGTEESCGDYIYGDINASLFLEYKPKDAIECAYINRYGEDLDNSYMMEYYYYNPLEWNADKSGYSGDYYCMVFYMEKESDTVTDIRISYDIIL